MSDVLSQGEIDNLLAAISDGGEEAAKEIEFEKKKRNLDIDENTIDDFGHRGGKKDDEDIKPGSIKEYNFMKPPKFNKEHLKTLEVISDGYARDLSSYLTGYLRTPVTIDIDGTEQMTFNEFMNTLPEPVVIGIVDANPLKGSMIFELSANISYTIVDRVLGGPGIAMKKLREFSEIELVLIKRILSQMVNMISKSWDNILPLNPRLDKIETNPQFAQVISPNEMVAAIKFRIKIANVEGVISICLPHIVISPVIDKFNMRYWYTNPVDMEDTTAIRDNLEERLNNTNLDVKAIIGKTKISVNEFVDLQVGDVVRLDSFIDADLQVQVGDVHKFSAKPGVSKNKYSVQITGVEREE